MKLSDPKLLKEKAYINGQWVDGDGGNTFPVYNPSTGEELAQVADLGAAETTRAVEAAHLAMQDWKAKTPKERASVLRRWHDLMIENQEDLAIIMTQEQGKVLAESRGEIGYGASFIEWFAEEGKRLYGTTIPLPISSQRGVTIRQPIGVVGAITPWNFPNAMITRKAGPALAVGCAIVIKPAAETPLSALALCELADRAGLPAGLLNMVTTRKSAPVGEVLTGHDLVRKFTFTGSTPVGKMLLKQCADTVKRTSMELGGNAPIIVFDDADLDAAVAGAIGSKYRNSGQTCICVNRMIVQEGIYDAFVEKLTAAVKAFKMGDGMCADSTHGPVITEKAIGDIHAMVESAVDDGATVVTGGKVSDLGSHFYEPTILTNVHDQMRVFREEIFGPVAPVFKFSTEAEAIAMANDTQFGLAAYVYTRDVGRVWRVSEGIEYGMVGVNEIAITSDVIPFGGVKESGMGREGSLHGIEDYTELKYICMGGI